MRDKDLYATILGVRAPWSVRDVQLRPAAQEFEVFIEHDGSEGLSCPQCGQACGRHDTRRRSWRHCDTCQFRTTLTAEVPRVRCPEHGVLQLAVPWPERGSRFTAMFESLAIDWLRETNLTAVSCRLRVSWDELDGIQQRAVRRGPARRAAEPVVRVGLDETSLQRRHEYVTMVSDRERDRVVHVADGHGHKALEGFYRGLPEPQCLTIEAMATDAWRPCIQARQAQLPGWATAVCFYRLDVAKRLGETVNDFRRSEQRLLLAEGDERLKRTRFLWLMGSQRRAQLDAEQCGRFDTLRGSTPKVARAWAIKETARELWRYTHRGWALQGWRRWLRWAARSRLEPMRKVARMLKEHLWGVINAVVQGVPSGTSESLNAKIQRVKKKASGLCDRERFQTEILFHSGGLDLYPRLARHPISSSATSDIKR